MAKKIINRIISPVEAFMAMETSGGILLIICTIIAMTWANSSYSEAYHHLVHIPVGFSWGEFLVEKSLLHWINDGLMAIFFFVVGLEIKKELVMGELSTPRKAALPMFAAIGGMVAPALIYAFLNPEGLASRGWGIPMATDIAFAVGILSLMGKRAPFALKIFLLALAIIDDLGAVLVIAFFYTEQISGTMIGVTAATLGFIFMLNKSGIRSMFVYVILGTIAWFALLKSGVHATIAGVLLGFLTPSRPWHNVADLPSKIQAINDRLTGNLKGDVQNHELHDRSKACLRELSHLADEGESPLDRLIHLLHPWVSFFIMPVFALANAGVNLSGVEFSSLLNNSISIGVSMGLFIGKPVGIVLACILAVKFKIAQLPSAISWRHVIAAGCLGGIGFTMALFISGLAFAGQPIEVFSKMGIITASILASLAGCAILLTGGKKAATTGT